MVTVDEHAYKTFIMSRLTANEKEAEDGTFFGVPKFR